MVVSLLHHVALNNPARQQRRTAREQPSECAANEDVGTQSRRCKGGKMKGGGASCRHSTQSLAPNLRLRENRMTLAHAEIPDCKYIRRKVPIREVACALGLSVIGNMVRCWRPDSHQHGDRTPSVGLHRRTNTAKCFVCDGRSLSPIDLVMLVRDVSLQEALAWITARYEVPGIPKGRHTGSHQRWPERYRAGSGTSRVGFVVRSGVFASLTPSERSILEVLDTFSDGEAVTISYRGIMRYSGIGSQSTIAAGLKRLQNLRMFKKQQRLAEDGLRACGSYRWTMDDPLFLEQVRETREREQEQIRLQRTMRAEAGRRIKVRGEPLSVQKSDGEQAQDKLELASVGGGKHCHSLPVNTLSSHRSKDRLHATACLHRDSPATETMPR